MFTPPHQKKKEMMFQNGRIGILTVAPPSPAGSAFLLAPRNRISLAPPLFLFHRSSAVPSVPHPSPSIVPNSSHSPAPEFRAVSSVPATGAGPFYGRVSRFGVPHRSTSIPSVPILVSSQRTPSRIQSRAVSTVSRNRRRLWNVPFFFLTASQTPSHGRVHERRLKRTN